MDQKPSKQLEELPPTEDGYWSGGDVQRTKPVKLPPICGTHHPDRIMEHVGYRMNGDGTVSCTKCAWGSWLPGYMKVIEDKLVDLRREARE